MKNPRFGPALAIVCAIIGLCCVGAVNSRASSKPATVTVPDLMGDAMGAVHKQLDDIDLEGAASNIYGDGGWSNDDGAVVVSFRPTAGTKVERYSTVTITFATKKELAFYKKPMPNLKGKQWDDLSATNPDLYLYFEVKHRDARDYEKPGAVVDQEPAKGTRMKLGARIKVTVADRVYTSPDGSGTGTWDPPNVNWPSPCRHTKWC